VYDFADMKLTGSSFLSSAAVSSTKSPRSSNQYESNPNLVSPGKRRANSVGSAESRAAPCRPTKRHKESNLAYLSLAADNAMVSYTETQRMVFFI
jgi:hypothetical protein